MKTLTPTTRQAQNSFNNKAHYEDKGGHITLLSYGTKVASHNKNTGVTELDFSHSTTTDRHIIAFVSMVHEVNLGNISDLREFIKKHPNKIRG